MTHPTPIAALPIIPAPRAAGCPLAPPAEFAVWRESDGLQQALWQGKKVWMISRYADIRDALVDPRLSANTMAYSVETTADQSSPSIFPRLDDPEHNRLRRMMARDFTFRRAETMRPQIQELVDRFLDDMIAAGPPADLVRSFALPVPSLVICLLLGVPYQDHDFFQRASSTSLDSSATEQQKAESSLALFTYMTELVARKEREPGDDMMSRLITDYVATGQLSRETAAMNGVIMLAAGHETTANMISLGTLALLDHPDEFDRLRNTDDPTVVAAVVEELMRYLTIVHSLIDRVATEDLTIGGQLIRAGETVLMNLPAGNYDGAFVERPELFDSTRGTRGHLGFGFGVHQCLGANLARVEMQVTLTTLARRLPGLRLAVPAQQLSFLNNKEIYGVTELPVTW
ncbi:cytochrome P450 [Mycolicibacterium komossense]|uniref:Cytochrome P450 n=1 Tax=Mycolicibacterium komossense TaxID=1779 RepID=A0ABT3CHY8_9MYCO|nr:cytochrome P450 [Mycolicibacterium komossense]MCV7228841.1 cytochrome P450 [Mycolicibacterium komossense]